MKSLSGCVRGLVIFSNLDKPIKSELIEKFYFLNSKCDSYEDREIRAKLNHIKHDSLTEAKQVKDGCCACTIY